MTIRLWLDDICPPPDESWMWCKTPLDIVTQLEGRNITKEPIEISFDYDLGDERFGTGHTVATYIEHCAYSGKMFNIVKWAIHSSNPVGRRDIQRVMESYERAKNENPE